MSSPLTPITNVVIDHREKGLKQLFQETKNTFTCKDIDVRFENLDLGDIKVISSMGTQTWVFERKCLADLQASIKDGRYHDQKRRLLEAYGSHNVFYIIEDGITFGVTTNSALKSAVINTIMRDHIGVFATRNVRDTFDLIVNIATKIHEDPAKYTNKDIDIGSTAKDTLSPACIATHKKESTYVNMLCQIPGVSLKTAKAIEAVFPSFHDLIESMRHVKDDGNEKLKRLKSIKTMDTKGGQRKISSRAIQNIIEILADHSNGRDTVQPQE